jgi:hypothetical protein
LGGQEKNYTRPFEARGFLYGFILNVLIKTLMMFGWKTKNRNLNS